MDWAGCDEGGGVLVAAVLFLSLMSTLALILALASTVMGTRGAKGVGVAAAAAG